MEAFEARRACEHSHGKSDHVAPSLSWQPRGIKKLLLPRRLLPLPRHHAATTTCATESLFYALIMANNSGNSSQQASAGTSSPPKAFAQVLPAPTVSPGSIKIKLPGAQQASAALFQRPTETQRSHTTSQRAESVLKSLYESGEYSDLTVVTGEATFKVHKNIVLPASAWLENAFQVRSRTNPLFLRFCNWHIANSRIFRLKALASRSPSQRKLSTPYSATSTPSRSRFCCPPNRT